jgi:hypothetical protein
VDCEGVAEACTKFYIWCVVGGTKLYKQLKKFLIVARLFGYYEDVACTFLSHDRNA